MELELEILENKSQRKGESCIGFTRKTGVISVSSTASKALKLKEGDRLAIAKDPKNEKDWYLIVFKNDTDPKGITCRSYGDSGSMVINCSAFSQAFMDQFCSRDDKSVKVPIGLNPNEILSGRAQAYAILTKALES